MAAMAVQWLTANTRSQVSISKGAVELGHFEGSIENQSTKTMKARLAARMASYSSQLLVLLLSFCK